MDATSAGIIGHVDAVTEGVITGWAYDPSAPLRPVDIEVWHDGVLLCALSANLFRDDLLAMGYGTGLHGFRLRLPLEIFRAPMIVIRVCAADGIDLVGSPVRVANAMTMIDAETLEAFSVAIKQAAAVSQSADDMRELTAWLLEHFSITYQRQATLRATADARRQQFLDVVGENGQLSTVLKQAAEAVTATFAPLHIDEHLVPDVSIIIPCYNNFAYTYRCVSSILEHMPESSIEIIIVDDGSTDETMFAGLILSGGISVIRVAKNTGFVHAINTGAERARGTYLFFLNNDAEATPGWLDELRTTFERGPDVGVVGSKLVFPDGRLQEAGAIVWRQGNAWNWGRDADANDPLYCFQRDVDYVSGAAMMVNRETFFRLGSLSQEFSPAYYEDTDFCFKIRAAGLRVVVQPLSKIIHHEGITSGKTITGPGAKRFQRLNHAKFLKKWHNDLGGHYLSGDELFAASERLVSQRILFIDDTVPTPNQDAGSNAAVEHMRSMQRLGFKVHFVPSDNMANIPPYTQNLERVGIQNYYAPYRWSVEDVLRRESATFDLVYIHRMMNYTKYSHLIRSRHPRASIVLNIADLHHLRLEREAEVAGAAGIHEDAARCKQLELSAINDADHVIVHSTFERDLLAKMGVTTPVHVVGWAIRPITSVRTFAQRQGLAFIGGFNHRPNVDATEWLVHDILPLVHAKNPSIECSLLGSHMPDSVKTLRRPGLHVIGQVDDLAEVLSQFRLMVAPLRYGAGLKGKVLTSFAAGLPCVSTPCAVEGMNIPTKLRSLIAKTPGEIAAAIVRLHEDEAENRRLADIGLGFIQTNYSQQKLDDDLEKIVGRADRRRD